MALGVTEVTGVFDFYRFDPESPVWSIFKYVATITILVVALIVVTERVKAGNKAIKLCFGDVQRYDDGTPKEIKPGLAWLVPGRDKLLPTSIQDCIVDLKPQIMLGPDGYTYDVWATLSYKIIRLDAALVTYQDVIGQLTMLASARLAQHLEWGWTTTLIERYFWLDFQLREEVWLRGAMVLGLKFVYIAQTQETRLARSFAIAGLNTRVTPELVGTLRAARELPVGTTNGHANVPAGGPA